MSMAKEQLSKLRQQSPTQAGGEGEINIPEQDGIGPREAQFLKMMLQARQDIDSWPEEDLDFDDDKAAFSMSTPAKKPDSAVAKKSHPASSPPPPKLGINHKKSKFRGELVSGGKVSGS